MFYCCEETPRNSYKRKHLAGACLYFQRCNPFSSWWGAWSHAHIRSSWEFYIWIQRQQEKRKMFNLAWTFNTQKPTLCPTRPHLLIPLKQFHQVGTKRTGCRQPMWWWVWVQQMWCGRCEPLSFACPTYASMKVLGGFLLTFLEVEFFFFFFFCTGYRVWNVLNANIQSSDLSLTTSPAWGDLFTWEPPTSPPPHVLMLVVVTRKPTFVMSFSFCNSLSICFVCSWVNISQKN